MNSRTRRIASVIIALAGIVITGTVIRSVGANQSQDRQQGIAILELVLNEVGLSPEVLATSGANGTQTAAALDGLRQLQGALTEQIDLAHHAVELAWHERDRLERLIRAGELGGESVDDLAMARLAHAQAQARLIEIRRGAIEATGLPADILSRLVSLALNPEQGLSAPARTAVVSADDRHTLRQLTSSFAVHARLGEDPGLQARARMAIFESRPEYQAAQSRYAANLDAVTTAWSLALTPR